MRTSECVVILPVIEQAIGAIDAAFERERQSREIAAEFEAEFNRRMEMPEGTAPKTELERHSAKQYEQDVRFPCYKQVKQGEQGEQVHNVKVVDQGVSELHQRAGQQILRHHRPLLLLFQRASGQSAPKLAARGPP